MARLQRFFMRIFKPGTFANSVAVLSSGTIAGQVLVILLSPVITRIYSPATIGSAQLVIAIGVTISVVASLKYDLALPMARNGESTRLLQLALGLILGFTLLAAVAVIAVEALDMDTELLRKIEGLTWFIPVLLLFEAVYALLYLYFIKFERFRTGALAKFSILGGTAILQVVLGLVLNPEEDIYLFAYGGGLLLALFTMTIVLIRQGEARQLASVDGRAIRAVAAEYKYFPLFSTWNSLGSVLARHLPLILLATLYSDTQVGLFALGIKLLNMPINLISMTTSNVFYQRISKYHQEGIRVVPFFISIAWKLFALGIVPVAILMWIGPQLFGFVFGAEWTEAGRIARILAPMYLIRFVATSVSNTFPVFKKQYYSLIWNLVFSLVILALFLEVAPGLQFFSLMKLYSIITAIMYLIMFAASIMVSIQGDRGKGAVDKETGPEE